MSARESASIGRGCCDGDRLGLDGADKRAKATCGSSRSGAGWGVSGQVCRYDRDARIVV